MLRNLKEIFLIFLIFKCHILLCKLVYTFTEHTVIQQHHCYLCWCCVTVCSKRCKEVLLLGNPIGRVNMFRQKNVIKMYHKELVCYGVS